MRPRVALDGAEAGPAVDRFGKVIDAASVVAVLLDQSEAINVDLLMGQRGNILVIRLGKGC